MWAIIPWLRVARTIATFGWLFSACCLLLVRLTMLELPLNFPTMSPWMVLKPPSRHSDFPRDFSNPNEFLFRWRMQTCDRKHEDTKPATCLTQKFAAQVNYLSHFLLTKQVLPLLQRSPGSRVVHLTSGAHRAAPAEGVPLTLEGKLPKLCQRVMICDDFVEKVSACVVFFKTKRCFNCWWSTSVFPTPIQTWLLALLNCQALYFLARLVSVFVSLFGPKMQASMTRTWAPMCLSCNVSGTARSHRKAITEYHRNFMSMDRCHHMPSYE